MASVRKYVVTPGVLLEWTVAVMFFPLSEIITSFALQIDWVRVDKISCSAVSLPALVGGGRPVYVGDGSQGGRRPSGPQEALLLKLDGFETGDQFGQ
jgi:hypothetical protein